MPRGKTQAVLTLIDVCRDILEEIQPASVRAVCDQLFVRGLLESMAKTCTNRISRALPQKGVLPQKSSGLPQK
jgi:hypothetical protein